MLNHYTPYLQFIAAIYFSMCFEQLLGRYFWNVSHQKKNDLLINNPIVSLNANKKYVESFTSKLEKQQEEYLSLVKKWSFILLFITMFLLLLSAIEPQFCEKGVTYWWVYFGFTIIITIPIVLFYIKEYRKTNPYLKKINGKITDANKQLTNLLRYEVFGIMSENIVDKDPDFAKKVLETVDCSITDINKIDLIKLAINDRRIDIRNKLLSDINSI